MYRLGVDLGGTNIVAGIVDENYNIIGSAKCKTAAPRPAEKIVEDIFKISKEAAENVGISLEDISAAGIGSPGLINPIEGIISFANNLKFKDVPLAKMLEDKMGLKFYLENDANAAAYGEYLAGCGKNSKHFIIITLGTGVGGGIIIDGKIYSGTNFAGAELGHITLDMNGDACSCGRRGCFETYASATALIKQTKYAMIEHPDSIMWKLVDGDINAVDGRTPFLAKDYNDEVGKKVVDRYVWYLAKGVSSVIAIFQPDVVALGGGISKEGDNLLKPVKEIIKNENFLNFVDKKTEIKTAVLGNDAGIIGAAYITDLYKN